MRGFDWEDRNKIEGSIQETVINNYTVKELCDNVKNERDDYIGTAKSADYCYQLFEGEVNELVSMDEARNLACGSTDYGDIKAVQVSEAIKLVMQDLYDDYKEIFANHPDKKLSEIVNEEFYYHWTGSANDNNYKSYKTIEEFIKNEFLCNEILTAQRAPSDLKQLSSNQCALISAVFHQEIKKSPKECKETITCPADIFETLEYVVNVHVDSLYDKIVKENKAAIIKHPELKINEAIAKAKAKKDQEMEK